MQPQVAFRDALRFWIKLGFISFGGPAGQIAILHRETVERRGWITEERFLAALNFCMLLPGPEAQQLATYIGWRMHGLRGALAAGGFFVLPSVFVLLALSWIYVRWGSVAAVAGALAGFKPVVVAIVAEAVLRIGRRALRGPSAVGIAAAAFVAIHWFAAPFPLIVAGALVAQFWFARKPAKSRLQADSLPHIAWRPVAGGLVLWAVPFAALIGWLGWRSLHAELWRFFSLAALVTFGGAYAVLAYVTQAVVHDYHWLTAAQAIDGLALAETTPGPLIMVLQFVGFQAVWNRTHELAPAVGGALVATYTTFLPSFVFVLAGAPVVERLKGGGLAAVTAAVVGVVLNLAIVFGQAVIRGWLDLAIAAAAFVVLARFKADVLWVVLAGGAGGILRTWAG